MMEERIPKSCSSSENEQKISKQGNIVPAIQIKENSNLSGIGLIEDETVIKEIEVGEGISAFHDGTIQELNEVIPEIILNEDDHSLTGENDISGKWSHNDIVIFLGVLNDVLDTQEEAGGFLSRKNLFSRVTTILNDQGKTVTRAEVEKKYNNMLITYRRCQQRLLKKGQTPYWPYFKLFGEVRMKDSRLHNLPSDLEPCVKKKRLLPTDKAHSSTKEENPFPTVPSSTSFDQSSKRFLPNWGEKRLQQDRKKLALVEELVGVSTKAAKSNEKIHRALREEDVVETDTLVALSGEIRATREEVTKNIRSVKVAVQNLTKLILSRSAAIL